MSVRKQAPKKQNSQQQQNQQSQEKRSSGLAREFGRTQSPRLKNAGKRSRVVQRAGAANCNVQVFAPNSVPIEDDFRTGNPMFVLPKTGKSIANSQPEAFELLKDEELWESAIETGELFAVMDNGVVQEFRAENPDDQELLENYSKPEVRYLAFPKHLGPADNCIFYEDKDSDPEIIPAGVFYCSLVVGKMDEEDFRAVIAANKTRDTGKDG